MFQKTSIHVHPQQGFFLGPPEFQFSSILSFKTFGFWYPPSPPLQPPHPQNFQWPSTVCIWIFFGTAHLKQCVDLSECLALTKSVVWRLKCTHLSYFWIENWSCFCTMSKSCVTFWPMRQNREFLISLLKKYQVSFS